VYHLGEYSRVEVSLTEPDVVWDANMNGTFGVLEFWRKRKPKLVYAGSSTKFADGGLARDQSPYAFTKATNTELIRDYAAWYGLPYAITYFYNVYGPGERAGKYGTVIEIFRQKHANAEPLTVVAPGTQKRIFTHVDDIVDGLMMVGERGDGDEFGLGAEKEYSVLDIARMFGGEISMLPERPGNRMNATLDTTKSHAIGWKAAHDVKDYIASIV
jgi:UDP-glucose 4-epimerase